MNFNLRKILFSVLILTTFFSSYSFSMNGGDKEFYHDIDSISINVAKGVTNLFRMSGINHVDYLVDNIRGSSQCYFRVNPDSLELINRGQNTNIIASGIYRYLELDDSYNKNIFIDKISEILLSFKKKSLKQKIFTIISTLNKTASVGASLFVAWGLYSRFAEGDRMGRDYAIQGSLVLAGTYLTGKFLRLFS